MWIYIAILVITFAIWPVFRGKSVIGIKNKKICGKTLYLFFFILMLFIIAGLRNEYIGSDTHTYHNIYLAIKRSNSFSSALKDSSISSVPIYVGLQYIISRLGVPDQTYMFVNYAIIAIPMFFYIKRESKNYMYSCFMFVSLGLFFESMNGNRQFMAVSLTLLSYSYLKKSLGSVKGWVLFVLAIGIHNTAAAFFLAYIPSFIKKRKTLKRAIKLSTIISLVVIVGLNAIIRVVVKLFPYFNIYLNGDNSAQFFESNGSGRIALVYSILLLTIILSEAFGNYSLVYKNSESKVNNRKTEILWNSSEFSDIYLAYLGALLGICFSKYILMGRILWPFLTTYICFLPNTLKNTKKEAKIVLYIVLTILLFIYCILFLLEDKSGIIPYKIF